MKISCLDWAAEFRATECRVLSSIFHSIAGSVQLQSQWQIDRASAKYCIGPERAGTQQWTVTRTAAAIDLRTILKNTDKGTFSISSISFHSGYISLIWFVGNCVRRGRLSFYGKAIREHLFRGAQCQIESHSNTLRKGSMSLTESNPRFQHFIIHVKTFQWSIISLSA